MNKKSSKKSDDFNAGFMDSIEKSLVFMKEKGLCNSMEEAKEQMLEIAGMLVPCNPEPEDEKDNEFYEWLESDRDRCTRPIIEAKQLIIEAFKSRGL